MESFTNTPSRTVIFEETTETLREKYLRNLLTEPQYKKQMGNTYRNFDYDKETNTILQTSFLDKMKHLVGRLLEKLTKAPTATPESRAILTKYTRRMQQALQTTEDLLEQHARTYHKTGFFKLICKKERTRSGVEIDRVSIALVKRISSSSSSPSEHKKCPRKNEFETLHGPPGNFFSNTFTDILLKYNN